MSDPASQSFFYQPITDTSSQSTEVTGQTCVQELTVKDSDEIFEIHCETCRRDGTHATASSFCISCVAYFCNTCLKYHGKFLPDHEYLEKDDMPQDVCTETCEVHKGELIKFYCVPCDKFACSICKRKEHNIHCTMKYLPDFVKDLENGKDFKDIITSSAEMINILSATEKMINTKHEFISNISEEVAGAIQRKKDDMFSKFDKEADEIGKKTQSMKKTDKQRFELVNDKFVPLKSEIDKLSSGVKEISMSPYSQKYKLFMAIKQMGHDLKQMEGPVRDLAKEFHSSEDSDNTGLREHANDLIERLEKFEKDAKGYDTKADGKVLQEQRKVASAMEEINVHDPSDTTDCRILHICLLSERYLIATDQNNCAIKLVDTTYKKLIYVRPVKRPPEAATKISATRIAMVQPFHMNEDRSIIQFLNVTSSKVLNFQKPYILTEMPCMDIIYVPEDRLVISLQQGHMGKIQVLNMNGSVLTSFETDEGETIFNCPYYITLNYDKKHVFVSDWYRDSITELDLENNSVRLLNHRFWHPESITVDEEGYIYVCEYGNNRIYVFRPDDTDSHILLDEDSDQWEPLSLCYSCTDKKLYIGQGSYDCIKVYSITDK